MELSQVATEIARARRIDPGHVLLCHAHRAPHHPWPLVSQASDLLGPFPDAIGLIREKMNGFMDRSALTEEQSEFVDRATSPQD